MRTDVMLWIIGIVVAAYTCFSLVYFIIDGINAKKEGRKRKVAPIVMFIIGIVISSIILTFIGFIGALAYAVMRGM